MTGEGKYDRKTLLVFLLLKSNEKLMVYLAYNNCDVSIKKNVKKTPGLLPTLGWNELLIIIILLNFIHA